MRLHLWLIAAALLLTTAVHAQDGPPPQGTRPPEPCGSARGGAPRGLPPGQWWENREVSDLLALTTEQRGAIDGVLRQSRPRLLELSQSIQREDFALQGLMDADKPDEPRIVSQVDRLASARAELEKANARMLLALRRVLTAEQWKKLQGFRQTHPPPGAAGLPPPR